MVKSNDNPKFKPPGTKPVRPERPDVDPDAEPDQDLPHEELTEKVEEKSAEETYNEHNSADAQEWPDAKQCQCDACEEHRGNQ